MTTQLALRLSDETLRDLDWLVTRLDYSSRTEAMRAAIATMIDKEKRREIGEQIADGYRQTPQTEAELEGVDEAVSESIAHEPWDAW